MRLGAHCLSCDINICIEPRSSHASAAVASWTADLTTKGRSKIAATIADPATHAELFEEGWADALAREEELLSGESLR